MPQWDDFGLPDREAAPPAAREGPFFATRRGVGQPSISISVKPSSISTSSSRSCWVAS